MYIYMYVCMHIRMCVYMYITIAGFSLREQKFYADLIFNVRQTARIYKILNLFFLTIL